MVQHLSTIYLKFCVKFSLAIFPFRPSIFL